MALNAPFQQTHKQPVLSKFYRQNRDQFNEPSLGCNLLMTHSFDYSSPMQRIMIMGSSGAGKSTLARHIGAQLELPVIHLDRHFWKPGWIPTPEDEWQETVCALAKRPSWIIDGNYRSTLNMRLEAADTIIFLDLPPAICAMRAIKRRIMYRNRPRPDITLGCKETLLDPKFPTFMQWIMDYPNRARPDVLYHLTKVRKQKRIIWLKSPRQVRAFMMMPKQKSLPFAPTPQFKTEPHLQIPTD